MKVAVNSKLLVRVISPFCNFISAMKRRALSHGYLRVIQAAHFSSRCSVFFVPESIAQTASVIACVT
jgi:hypothetical protein